MKKQLRPVTENHFNYIKTIAENNYTLVKGPAGSSKSYTAVGMASQYLTDRKVNRIIVSRPMVQTGRHTIGFLKGDVKEKVLPFLLPLIEHFYYFLGKEETESLIEHDLITLLPLELARGMNFNNSFVILDECQNADFGQIKMFLTRLGRNSKMVINGDTDQSDLDVCDFEEIITRLDGAPNVGIVKLTNKDIMRSKDIAEILRRLS